MCEPVTQVILLAKVINTHARLQLTNVPQQLTQTSTRSIRCRCERNHDDTKPSGSVRFRNTNTDPLSLPVSFWCNSFSFYRATLCVSTVFAVAWCLSVCLSVTLVHCIQTAEDIVKLLCRPGRPIILLFWPQRRSQFQAEPTKYKGLENLGISD